MTSLFPPFDRRTSFRKQPFFYEAGRGVHTRGLGGLGQTLNLNFTSGVLDPRITFSRPSNATLYDSTGKLTYAPNNLLLNSATLSTQSVTTAPINYILSFKGTGSVARSGTSTGTLSGTGATDRVYVSFTPTAGTLTLTVTGSITDAQLEAVTYQTTPSTYVATTSAAYYGPRFDYNPTTLAANGLLIEEARTNLTIYSEQFNNANWPRFGTTSLTANTSIAPDGLTSADQLTLTSAGAGMFQSVSAAASTAYTFTIWIKAASSLTANIVLNTNLSDPVILSVSVTTNWQRFSVTKTTSVGTTSISAQVQDTGSGGTVLQIWGAQLEAGAFFTSYIPTAASSVARSADTASMTGTNFSSWYNQSEGTFVADVNCFSKANNAGVLSADNGTTNERIQLRRNGALDVLSSIVAAGGVVSVNASQGAFPISSAVKIGAALKANDYAAYTNGVQAYTTAGVVMPSPNQLVIGGGASISALNGTIKSLAYYNKRLSNAQLQSLTT